MVVGVGGSFLDLFAKKKLTTNYFSLVIILQSSGCFSDLLKFKYVLLSKNENLLIIFKKII